jgi:DNA-binding XRE family transcriptional regulator
MVLEGEGVPDEYGKPAVSRAAGAVSGSAAPGAPGDPGPAGPDEAGAGGPGGNAAGEPGEPQARLPLLPGFREMALRRMAAGRGRLVRELAARRQEASLSQTEVAARMGTSQSAVARLESGEADARASTLERYAAAIGSQITWKLEA